MTVVQNITKPRSTGVTILMGNQVMFTQPPSEQDRRFLAQAVHWINEHQRGKPPNA